MYIVLINILEEEDKHSEVFSQPSDSFLLPASSTLCVNLCKPVFIYLVISNTIMYHLNRLRELLIWLFL